MSISLRDSVKRQFFLNIKAKSPFPGLIGSLNYSQILYHCHQVDGIFRFKVNTKLPHPLFYRTKTIGQHIDSLKMISDFLLGQTFCQVRH
ncbi:MAG: hypothetical protein CL529_10295 [Aequorivita sp.]|nr:hypothetical protein [Aequorivita sp.]